VGNIRPDTKVSFCAVAKITCKAGSCEVLPRKFGPVSFSAGAVATEPREYDENRCYQRLPFQS